MTSASETKLPRVIVRSVSFTKIIGSRFARADFPFRWHYLRGFAI